jgi:hypothetical protein
MKLIAKDVKFNQGKKYSDRIFKTLLSLITEPNKTFI